jgi:hypothetical protein
MNENLIKVLNEFGQELKQLLKENIEAEGGVATGDMLNSIDYEVDEETGEIVLYLLSTEYFKWWDQGTTAHWPPKEPILKWIENKPIVPEERIDSKGNHYLPTVDQLAFLIRRKIAGESPTGKPGGTPSHGRLKAVADLLSDTYAERIGAAIIQDFMEAEDFPLEIDIKI